MIKTQSGKLRLPYELEITEEIDLVVVFPQKSSMGLDKRY